MCSPLGLGAGGEHNPAEGQGLELTPGYHPLQGVLGTSQMGPVTSQMGPVTRGLFYPSAWQPLPQEQSPHLSFLWGRSQVLLPALLTRLGAGRGGAGGDTQRAGTDQLQPLRRGLERRDFSSEPRHNRAARPMQAGPLCGGTSPQGPSGTERARPQLPARLSLSSNGAEETYRDHGASS